ncbi:uncharacterized protein LOC126675331 [Mercurialis annua]|uniref:uncharacterized protein LOC126675331 n=1 Tax=Mercurialis annua TaxID=3986 RepID=UPI00215F1AC9|nr:uncharacterized protein LOC126675331 [Mercurialis annua]
MYVTRPLSMYIRDPSAISLPPPEGPNSGILVIKDEEAERTRCFGLCTDNRVKEFPFPQNKNLKVEYVQQAGQIQHVHINRVVFIPVLNQPLSSNLYYCIERNGKHKGEAYKNSTEEDMTTCCFCSRIKDLKPQPLDPQDTYQQLEIIRRKWGSFAAKSLAPDGFPPLFLRRKGWRVVTTKREFELTEALGLDKTLRNRLPEFTFPLSEQSSKPVTVGKWYCPFMFIKDGSPKDQVDKSRFYEMRLEQKWERVFACENNGKTGNSVNVDVVIETETVGGGEGNNVGLSLEIVERMKWEEVRFGWTDLDEKKVRVIKVEEFGGLGEWKKFGLYVLVERFVLKRMDGSLVLAYDFRHIQHIRTKWE